MRKEIVPAAADDGSWLDLEACSQVRLTSEDPSSPVEFALREHPGHGWRAAQPGPQTLWIDFDAPQDIGEIFLRFEVAGSQTQEFLLSSSNDDGRTYREIVRQPFNFSAGTSVEEEHYFPQLTGVTDLKLTIIPDIRGGNVRASLQALRIR